MGGAATIERKGIQLKDREPAKDLHMHVAVTGGKTI